MSEIKRFNDDVIASEQMQSEVKAIGNDIEKIVTYANEKGYQFTLGDIQNAVSVDEELSEDQLDNVAGGSTVLVGVAGAFMDVVCIA